MSQKPIGFRLYTKSHCSETDRYHDAVNDADARIADQAADLFHQHGITATGVEALSHAAGISKRTLYERFGSKDGLIAAAFDIRDLPVFRMYTESAELEPTPREQLKAVFATL